MEQLVLDALPWVRVAVVVVFVSLAAVAVARAPRMGAAGWWMAAAFGSLAVVLVALWVPNTIDVELPGWFENVAVLPVIALPYFLLRFTASFRELPRWIEITAAAVLFIVAVMTFAVVMPSSLTDPLTPLLGAYIAVLLTYWVAVSLVTVVRLWRAGSGQPTVARRRMRLMSAATAVLMVTLLASLQPHAGAPILDLIVDFSALASALAFGLGFSPPRLVRLSWRGPEEQQLLAATIAVLRAPTIREIAAELLPPTTRIVGGGGAVLTDADGHVVATHGHAPEVGVHLDEHTDAGDEPAREVVPLGDSYGDLIVWTSPYAPFFGREEAELLRSMAAVVSLALERCDLLADERAQRSALQDARQDAEQSRDAAERSRYEAELARQEAEQARDRARRADTAKSEFLSRMSHELRTPLNAILGFGQLMETSDLDHDDEEAVGHILKAGHHLLALINDVLDLSRIEAGTMTVSTEPVHASELIADSVALIRQQAQSRSIRITVNNDGRDLYVKTDRQRCRQALLNLLSNAVKYNHDGGEVTIDCGLTTDGAVRIAVGDTGPGISPSRIGQLFEPFERLGAEDSSVEGTGLGLALTKQLVERLDGTIGVESTPGQGTTFWIDMPLTETPPDAVDNIDVPTPAELSDEQTLLLVEDNLANLRLVEAMLRRRPGITVIPAMQGGIAIDLAHQHQPDVIILDLHLPDLPGRDVLYRLKADPKTRDIPVIIASADATPGRVKQLREEGAFDYITKPLDLQDFLDAVDAALTYTPIQSTRS